MCLALQRLLFNRHALESCGHALRSSEAPSNALLGFHFYMRTKTTRGRRCASTVALIPISEKSEEAVTYGEEKDNIARKVALSTWQRQLTDYEDYDYQSNLDSLHTDASRIICDPIYGKDQTLWLELLQFRRRNYGDNGIMTIWKAMRRLEFQLPTYGSVAGELWENLIELGLQKPLVLQEVIQHARKRLRETGSRWPKLYQRVVVHYLETDPLTACRWHKRLYKKFPPNRQQLQAIFQRFLSNSQAIGALQMIYKQLRYNSLYSYIVPELCRREEYNQAIAWHNILIEANDLPRCSLEVEPLMHYLALYGDQNQLVDLTKAMVDAGVPFPQAFKQPFRENTFISREMMNRMHGDRYGIVPKNLSDEFCARLFATSLFSIDTVVSGLRFLGIDAVGPLAFREILARESYNASDVSRRIDSLRAAGLSIGNSVFSTMVRKFALEGKTTLLEDLVRCDQHPEALEDWKLQETLLASYQQAGDQTQFERTMAILMLNASSSPSRQAHEQWNLLLRTYVTRRDVKGMLKIITAMRERHILISPKSCGYVRLCLLPRRQRGRSSAMLGDVPLVINIWQGVLLSGGALPSKAWIEMLRRLGMLGRLRELEKLALWLAQWYTSRAFRASEVSLTSRLGHETAVPISVPTSLPPTHPRHPLRIIFTDVAQRAIITWGFQHTKDHGQRIVYPPEARHPSWDWGLHLLYNLKLCGVAISRRTIESACRHRMETIYGPSISKRRINRRSRVVLQKRDMGEFLQRMEPLLGGGVGKRIPRFLSRKYRRAWRNPKHRAVTSSVDGLWTEAKIITL